MVPTLPGEDGEDGEDGEVRGRSEGAGAPILEGEGFLLFFVNKKGPPGDMRGECEWVDSVDASQIGVSGVGGGGKLV